MIEYIIQYIYQYNLKILNYELTSNLRSNNICFLFLVEPYKLKIFPIQTICSKVPTTH